MPGTFHFPRAAAPQAAAPQAAARGGGNDTGWELDINVSTPPKRNDRRWVVTVEQLRLAMTLLNMDELVPFNEWSKEPTEVVAAYERSGLSWHASVLRRARWCFEIAYHQASTNRTLATEIRRKLNIPVGFEYDQWTRQNRARHGHRALHDTGGESPEFIDHVYGIPPPVAAGADRQAQADLAAATEVRQRADATREVAVSKAKARRLHGDGWKKDMGGYWYPARHTWPNQVLRPVLFRAHADELMLQNGVSINANPADDLTCRNTNTTAGIDTMRQNRLKPPPRGYENPIKRVGATYTFNFPPLDVAEGHGFEIRARQSVTLTPYQKAVKLICSPRTTADSLLIWHPTGSGKTISMIAVMNNLVVDWLIQPQRQVFVIVPNAAVEQELTRNILVDPGFIGTKLRTMNKGRRIATGSFLTTAQVKELNKMVLITTYRKIGPRLGYDADGSRRRPPKEHQSLAPDDADDSFNPFDNGCIIMDEVHNLLDITIKRDKSTLGAVLSLRHTIADAHNLKAYGFTATPNPNEPLEIISLLNYMRCNSSHRIKPHLDAGGAGVSTALLEDASTMISHYSTDYDSKRFPKVRISVLPVPLSRDQYENLKPWYKHFFGDTNGDWTHDKRKNPFVRSNTLDRAPARLTDSKRLVDVTERYVGGERDRYEPTQAERRRTHTRDMGYGATAAGQGGGPLQKNTLAAPLPADDPDNPWGRAAKPGGGRGRGKGKAKGKAKGKGKGRGRGRGRNVGGGDDDDELLGNFSDDADEFVMGEALGLDDIVHPVWGTGKVLKMWNQARQVCYSAQGAWRNLKADNGRLEHLLQNSYALAPKLEMLVSQLAYYSAHGTAETGQSVMGKHLVFANFKGPGLHAVVQFLAGLGFERIASPAQLAASIQSRPDSFRFIALENMNKEAKVLLRMFNAQDNSKGGKVSIAVLYTPMFGEGVDFKDVACLHIMDPPGTYGELQQIIGRPCRLCSHARLEPLYGDNIVVDVFIYCSVVGHAEFYNGNMSMYEFGLKFAEHLRASGVKDRAGGVYTTNTPYHLWPLMNSTPDELTLKHVIEKKLTSDGIVNTISKFAADRIVSYDRRVARTGR